MPHKFMLDTELTFVPSVTSILGTSKYPGVQIYMRQVFIDISVALFISLSTHSLNFR